MAKRIAWMAGYGSALPMWAPVFRRQLRRDDRRRDGRGIPPR